MSAPFPKRYLDSVAEHVEFAHDCRWGNVFETFIAISCNVCACELRKRPVRNRSAQYRIDARLLSMRTALGRLHLVAVTRQKLAQCRFFSQARVSDPP